MTSYTDFSERAVRLNHRSFRLPPVRFRCISNHRPMLTVVVLVSALIIASVQGLVMTPNRYTRKRFTTHPHSSRYHHTGKIEADQHEEDVHVPVHVPVCMSGEHSDSTCSSRRNVLLGGGAGASLLTALPSALWLLLQLQLPVEAAHAVSPQSPLSPLKTTSPTSSQGPSSTLIAPDEAIVTDKVFFDIRISRQDGTFYVRDDLPDTPENQVFSGRLVLGLFGKNAPNHVERFLQYVNVNANTDNAKSRLAVTDDMDNPLPSYSRSSFTQFDAATGVLYGGTIPSLSVTELQGSTALRYGGRLFPAKLWLENYTTAEQQLTASRTTAAPRKISHSSAGLLTHKQFDVTPVFGITTRSDTTELDRTHTVFGKLIADASSEAFLQRVANLPTYSLDRQAFADSAVVVTNDSNSAVQMRRLDSDVVADAVYAAQRDFFRGAAQSLGDTRVTKLYEGKLLRRVEVTQVGVLQ
jgi:cyclophilin family peptidyl-prolyl cis-trans isomerase